MKNRLILFLTLLCLFDSCKQKTDAPTESANEVIVLGMIHSGHKSSESYGIAELKKIIIEIAPDYILTEIPPDRFPTAMKEFEELDSIKEPRVVRFPEYVDVIFPLTKEMDFEIIPTAGWTKEMADARRKRLKEISTDSLWKEQWQEYMAANQKSDSVMNTYARRDDPYFVNSKAYDDAAEIYLSVYNKLFNDELGPGGWDNINKAHYGYIEKALDKHQGKGKRFLITYGAGHKGWFLRALEKRDDIQLLDARPFLDKALKQ